MLKFPVVFSLVAALVGAGFLAQTAQRAIFLGDALLLCAILAVLASIHRSVGWKLISAPLTTTAMRKMLYGFSLLVALASAIFSPVSAAAQALMFLGAGTPYAVGAPYPTAMTIDSSGNIFVADTYTPDNKSIGGGIYELPANNGYSGAAYYPLPNTYNYPNAIATDANGNVYVTDSYNTAVYELTASSGFSTVTALGSGWAAPGSVAVDRIGDVYVQDGGGIKMLKAVGGVIPASPTVYQLTTCCTYYSSSRYFPMYLSVDSQGDVFFEAAYGNTWEVFVLTERSSIGSNSYNTPFPFAYLNGQGTMLVDSNHDVFAPFFDRGIGEIPNANIGAYPETNLFTETTGGYFDINSGAQSIALNSGGDLFALSVTRTVNQLLPGGTNFGSVGVGVTSPTTVPLNFYFADTSTTIGSVAVLTDGIAGRDFADAGGDTCVAGLNGSQTETCVINVSFTPTAAGPRTGAIVIYDNTGAVMGTAYVQGTGTANVTYSAPVQSTVVTGLSTPTGIAIDGSGNIYVANSGTSELIKETLSSGSYSATSIGSGFSSTSGVAVDAANNVYVSDPTGEETYKETPGDAGYLQSDVTTGFNEDYTALAVDNNGTLYEIAGAGVTEIVLPQDPYGYLDPSGLVTPVSIAIDSSGAGYIVDSGNATLHKETPGPTGQYGQTTIGSGFVTPVAVAVDGAGNIYVADSGLDEVIEETPVAGTTTYTQSVVPVSGLVAPSALAVDQFNNLYIADSSSNTIVELNFNQTEISTPSITTLPTASAITYGQTLASSTLSGGVASVPGTFTWTTPSTAPGAGTASYSVTFTPDNTTNYTTVTSSVTLTVAQATPTLTWPTPAAIVYGTALSSTQLDATSSVNGTFSYTPAAGTVPTAGTQSLSVTFTPYDATDYTTATSSVTLTVTQATPTLTWPTPAAIPYGTALSATQLDATASVAGNFVYTPPSGTVLSPGANTLSVTFTPYDTTDYNSPTATVNLQVYQLAALTAPTPGTALSGASATFSWTAGVDVSAYFFQLGTKGVGSSNLFNLGATSALSTSVTGLPVNGETLYARLGSKVNGVWQTVDYTYIAASTPAAITSPTPGTALGGADVTFSWSAGSGVTAYFLSVGTTGVGSRNIYNGAATTSLTAAVTGLPTNGATVYVRLGSKINGIWQTADYTYIAAATPAVLTTPAPGTELASANVTFSWTAGVGVTEYFFQLGTKGVGSNNLYNPGATTALSAAVTGLPANGETLYARLGSKINGVWQTTDYTYTAAATPAALTTPAPGTMLSGASVTFSWTAGVGVTEYFFQLGTKGVGSNNLYNPGATTALSASVTGLPANGETLYARLGSKINGVWQTTDYTYTAAATPAALTTPTPGTTLAGASVTFTWTTGAGVSEYFFQLGTKGVGSSNLYNPGATTATSASVTGLPTSGGTIYARLGSKINGVWQTTDYTYTAQ